ncbi:MAG TPA: alkaline phosphatase family protein, partial [Thermoanaerobaculia bacterium]|nr:alkaline phosphatase family protein [Thermoanaerobaculia bacterium]
MNLLAAAAVAGTLLAATPPSRVVVLAFDGVDAALVESMMGSGRLPNLAALAARGGYTPLTPPVPPQTPVSWTSFATGLDPGGHQIFDFLKRDPADMTPTFAVAQEKEVPFLLGKNTPAAAAAILATFLLLPAVVLASRRRRFAAAVL